MTQTTSSFLQRVRNSLPSLHPAERRLADFVLNFPGELAAYTAAELAKLANVSAATVSRFVQKLGYANYEEARRDVRSERKAGAALFMVSAASAGPGAEMQGHLAQSHANLDATFAAIPPQEIDGLAQRMLTARQVVVIGYRTSHCLANYLYWQCLQAVERILLLPRSGETMAEHVASLRPEDCVIVLGLARRAQALPEVLEQIKASGAAIAYVTDEGVARRDDLDWHFLCHTVAPGPLFGHASVIALMHLIATRVIELSGAEGRRRLTRIESLHESLGEI